jgi:hypothetical protein
MRVRRRCRLARKLLHHVNATFAAFAHDQKPAKKTVKRKVRDDDDDDDDDNDGDDDGGSKATAHVPLKKR